MVLTTARVAIKPSSNPVGGASAPRFLHPLRSEKAQQGQRNQPLPAERTACLHRDAQHFRIDQRRYPLSPRRPLYDGPLAGPIARKGGRSCPDDGNQQENPGHGETAENWAKLDGQPRVSRHAQKDKRQQGCAAGDGLRNKETARKSGLCLDPENDIVLQIFKHLRPAAGRE
jgi:hypothetical protein